jgi:predicted dehydrogenase
MLRVGVVGVGSLGEHHARIYSQIDDVKLAGVCDLDAGKGRRVADAYGTQYFQDSEELLGEVDAISLVVPTVSHAELAIRFLRQGTHVLVEKPIASTLEEAQRMIGAADASGRILQVGHLERFNPAVLAFKPYITVPRFFEGHRLSVFVPRSLDIDVVLDLMIHDLDLVLSFVQSEVRQIQAIGIPVLTPRIDIANARIEFENGCVANLTASRVSDEKVRKLRFFQRDSYVSLDFLKREADFVSLEPGPGPLGMQIVRNKLTGSNVEPLRVEIVSFLDSINGKCAVPCTGHDGMKALDLALRILEVMRRQ